MQEWSNKAYCMLTSAIRGILMAFLLTACLASGLRIRTVKNVALEALTSYRYFPWS